MGNRASRSSLLLLGTNPAYTLIPSLMLGMDVKRQTYEDLMKGVRIEFKNKTVTVALFFPYPFWDAHCEIPDGDAVYGVDRRVYIRFKNYWRRVEKSLRETYPDKDLRFVNDPSMIFVDRDKLETHRIFSRAGVNVTETIDSRDVDGVISQIRPDRGVYIKSRYGAEGKGITRLRKKKWETNYKVTGRGPKNHGTYDEWEFTDFTGNRAFLKRLLATDVIVEREIVPPKLFEGRKYDVRVYYVYGKAVHVFLRHAPTKSPITNYSQGGIVDDDYRTHLTEAQLASATRESLKAAKALRSDFGAIDVMFDDKDPDRAVIVEAQTMCGFPKPEACNLGAELAKAIIARN